MEGSGLTCCDGLRVWIQVRILRRKKKRNSILPLLPFHPLLLLQCLILQGLRLLHLVPLISILSLLRYQVCATRLPMDRANIGSLLCMCTQTSSYYLYFLFKSIKVTKKKKSTTCPKPHRWGVMSAYPATPAPSGHCFTASSRAGAAGGYESPSWCWHVRRKECLSGL